MHATVTRQVLTPTLLPGATGRADARAQERDAIVSALADLLDAAGLADASPTAAPEGSSGTRPVSGAAPGASSLSGAAPGASSLSGAAPGASSLSGGASGTISPPGGASGTSSPPGGALGATSPRGVAPVPVLVVAPARRTTLSVDARPDLGALGLAPGTTAAGHAPVPSGQVPPLGVTASVAVTLLRLAGWDGPVETLELSGGLDVDAEHLDEILSGRSLVLVALAAAEVDLPAGAPPALAAGQAFVWQVADRLTRG